MKNLITCLICCAAFHLQAQFSIGIKGGYTNSWADYGDVELPDDAQIDVNGSHITTLTYYRINSNLQVGVEPGFVRRGAACYPGRWGWGNNPPPPEPAFLVDETRIYLRYLELPAMVAGNLSIGKSNFEIQGKVGFGASYLTGAFRTETFINSDEPPVPTEILMNSASVFNRWDHGFYGGVGFGFNIGKHQIFAESDFYFGLKDPEKFNTTKNRSLDFSLGYLVRL